MNNNLVTAVFDGRAEAERAAAELRSAGVPDSALSVIARQEGAEGDWGDADTTEVGEKKSFLEGVADGRAWPACRHPRRLCSASPRSPFRVSDHWSRRATAHRLPASRQPSPAASAPVRR